MSQKGEFKMLKEFIKRSFVTILLMFASSACFRVGSVENITRLDFAMNITVGYVLFIWAFYYLFSMVFDKVGNNRTPPTKVMYDFGKSIYLKIQMKKKKED